MNTTKTIALLIAALVHTSAMALPINFVYLSDADPSIKQDIRYYSANNFIGERIHGYEAPTCILTRDAALKLAAIQRQLQQQSLSLLVYDCYRPQQAVDHFVAWSEDPFDQRNKQAYYPHVDKRNLFYEGYISKSSGHTRGSTVDLTIVNLAMGTHFDYLDPLSHPLSKQIKGQARQNRFLLRNIMLQHGFIPLATEWWHFTLADEPYPVTYFNFPVR